MHVARVTTNFQSYTNSYMVNFGASKEPEQKSQIINQYMQILSNPEEAMKMKTVGIEELEKDCIQQLEDNKLRKLCTTVLEKSPVEMFVVPASSQGQNHPKDEFVPGSMVKHIKRTFQMAKYSAVRHGLDEKDTDIMLAAAILHDFPAKFIPDGETAYKKDIDHAVKNAIFIENQMKKMGFDKQTTEKLCAGVGFHTGRFDRHINTEWLEKHKKYKNTPYSNVVQEADYYASRPCVFVEIK